VERTGGTNKAQLPHVFVGIAMENNIMDDKTKVTDKSSDKPKETDAQQYQPSLEDRENFQKQQQPQSTDTGKRVITAEHQESFRLYDASKEPATTKYGDGTEKTRYPDGVEVTETKDLKMTVKPDGGEIDEFADGTRVIKTRDGIQAERDRNGIMRLTDTDGKTIAVAPDGTCSPPIENSGFTVEKESDGTTIIRGKDGSAAMFAPDGRIVAGKGDDAARVCKEGVEYKPDGSWSDFGVPAGEARSQTVKANADGTVTRTDSMGNKTVRDKDGSVRSLE